MVKDLAALYFSAMNIGLTQRDFLRFIKNYRGRELREIFKSEIKLWDKVEQKTRVLSGMPEREKVIATLGPIIIKPKKSVVSIIIVQDIGFTHSVWPCRR